ncbi:MAG: alpha/beta hydrolase [Jatrophihabitantaceae bacterium]
MALLGEQLLILLGALSVVVPALAFLLWRRVRGPRAVRVLQRLAMVGASQLVAVLLVAAAVNDYGFFYNSWTELADGITQTAGLRSAHDPQLQRTVRRSGVAPASAGSIKIRSDPGYSTPNQWATRGRLESVTIDGALSRLKSHAYVYLPPQYFQASYANTSFPAVEVFTGYPGIDTYLVSRMKYQDVLLRLIHAHQAQPTVLVMLRPSVTYPRDTECTDVPAGPQAETFFASDIPAQTVDEYRVLPTGWGAMGDSTGGYCAAKLAMLHPDVFWAAAEMSGYFFALKDRTTHDLWGGSPIVRDLNDLRWRLAHQPAPPVSLLVGTSPSERGPDGYVGARQFLRLARAPMTVDMMTVPHGGHNIATWTAELPHALAWLSAKLPVPSVAP